MSRNACMVNALQLDSSLDNYINKDKAKKPKEFKKIIDFVSGITEGVAIDCVSDIFSQRILKTGQLFRSSLKGPVELISTIVSDEMAKNIASSVNLTKKFGRIPGLIIKHGISGVLCAAVGSLIKVYLEAAGLDIRSNDDDDDDDDIFYTNFLKPPDPPAGNGYSSSMKIPSTSTQQDERAVYRGKEGNDSPNTVDKTESGDGGHVALQIAAALALLGAAIMCTPALGLAVPCVLLCSQGAHGKGGVEFKKPQPIIGFQDILTLPSLEHVILFDNLDKKEIFSVLDRIVLPTMRKSIKNVEDLFNCIMDELSEGLFLYNELPSISLHFNQNALLYTVMHPYYKTTLVGHVIGLVDYFLKGFVNGGFFSEDFIYHWHENKNTDLEYLESELISIKKIAKDLSLPYYSINELEMIENEEKQDFLAAFRIVNKLLNVENDGMILKPFCSFDVESDLNPLPNCADEKKIDKVKSAHQMMKNFIKIIMPEIPNFKGYFDIMKMITFAAHYLVSLNSIGLSPKLADKSIKPIVQNFPQVFPPLPVRKIKKIKIVITLKDFSNKYTAMQKKLINSQMIEILKEKRQFFDSSVNILIKDMTKELYMYQLMKEFKKFELYDISDDDMRVPYIIELSFSLFKDIPQSVKKCLLNNMIEFCKQINQRFEFNFGIKDPSKYSTYIKIRNKYYKIIENFKKKTRIHLESFREEYNHQLNQLYNLKIQIIDQKIEIKLLKKKKNMQNNGDYNNVVFLQKQNEYKAEIEEDFESERALIRNEKYKSMKENDQDIKEKYSKMEEMILQNKQNLDLAENDLFRFIEKNMSLFEISQEKSLSILTFNVKNNTIAHNIHGGCTINVTNKVNLSKKEIDPSIKELISHQKVSAQTKFITINVFNQNEYFINRLFSIKSNLNSTFQKALLGISDISNNYSPNYAKITNNNDMNIAHYAAIGSPDLLSKIDKKLLLAQSKNDLSPIIIACSSGNYDAVDSLIKRGIRFDKQLDNGVFPLLIVLQNGNEKIAKLLLQNKDLIGDINRSTETKKTPLYWAIHHNLPDIVRLLVQQGAKINIQLQKSGLDLFSYAAKKGRLECLQYMIKSYSQKKAFDGKTPLHHCSRSSLLCTKMLIESKKMKLDEKDLFGNTPSIVALKNGQFEICNEILKNGGKNSSKLQDIAKLMKAYQIIPYKLVDVINSQTIFNQMLLALKQNNVHNLYVSIAKLNSYNFNNLEISQIYEAACVGRNSEFPNILRTQLNLDCCPLLNLIGKNGLVDWIRSLIGIGVKFDFNESSLLDDAVKAENSVMIKEIFTCFGTNIPNKVLFRNIKNAILAQRQKPIHLLLEKINNIEQLLTNDIFSPDIFKIYIFSLPISCFTPEFFYKMVIWAKSNNLKILLSKKQYSDNDISHAYHLAIKNKRYDNAFILKEKFPSLPDNENVDKIKGILENIEKILSENKQFISQEAMNKLSVYLGYMDLSSPLLPKTQKTIIQYALDNKSFWFFDIIPNNFDLQPNDFKLFDSAIALKSMIRSFFRYFQNKNRIELFLDIFTKQIIYEINNNQLQNEFIEELFDILKNENILALNRKGQTCIHICSRLTSLTPRSIEIIMKNISEKIIKILDYKNRNILMMYTSAGQIEIIEAIIQYHSDILMKDIFGNNVLHYAFSDRNKQKLFISCLYCIIEPALILSQNQKRETPWHLAAKAGSNGSLGMMTNYYSISRLDKIDSGSPLVSLHYAAMSNHAATIKYLVETLHVNINIKSLPQMEEGKLISSGGMTPLCFAATYNCYLAFKELINMGANSLELTDNGKSCFSFACQFGDKELIKYALSLNTSNKFLRKNELFLDFAQNRVAPSEFTHYMFEKMGSNINVINKNGESMLINAAKNNNHEIVGELLCYGANPFHTDYLGYNALHYCAIINSISCSGAILQTIYSICGSRKLNEYLKETTPTLNTALHIACIKGYLPFVVHLLKFGCDPNLAPNSDGLTPMNCAIVNNNMDIAKLLAFYCDKANSYVHNKTGEKNIIDNFWKDFDKNGCPEHEIYLDIRKNIIVFNDKVDKEEEEEEKGTDNKGSSLNISLFNEFVHELGNLVGCNKKLIENNEWWLNVRCLQNLLIELGNNKTKSIINDFFEQCSKIGGRKTGRNFIDLFVSTVLLCSDCSSLASNLNFFIRLSNNKDLMNFEYSHPIWKWIECALASACCCNVSMPIIDVLNNVEKFVSTLMEKQLISSLKFPNTSIPCFKAIEQLLKIICERSVRRSMFHLKYIDYFPLCRLCDIDILLKNNYILHTYTTQFGGAFSALLIETLKNVNPVIIDSVFEMTEDIYSNDYLTYDQKARIVYSCNDMFKKLSSNKKKTIETANYIRAWFIYSIEYIDCFGESSYQKILHTISKSKTNDSPLENGVNILIEKLNKNQKQKEVRSDDELICAFQSSSNKITDLSVFVFDGTPMFSLPKDEIDQLKIILNIISNTPIIPRSEMPLKCRNLSSNFKNNPTIANLANLIGYVSKGIGEILSMTPFMVQNLTVAGLFLHFVNQSKREALKGRIAQVATGEGKSLIIAETAIIAALLGNFVDVVTTSKKLAERDAEKFKLLYDAFGISSSFITIDSPKREDFNGVILYGTNTDFEFAYLRENTNLTQNMYTVPLDGVNYIPRSFDFVIIDESDNLFLDTISNAALISHESSENNSWVYQAIYQKVTSNIHCSIEDIKAELSSQQQGITFTDQQIKTWKENVFIALRKVKGVDYIVTDDHEIKIVDSDNTGRIQHNSRWLGGIHEFVEVKEGIKPNAESLVMALITHPPFFAMYTTIMGLTGTCGQEEEREEILSYYKVDSFDVPPNKPCRRIRKPTTIVDNKAEKFDKLVEIIKEMQKMQRPILIILPTLNDSVDFSEKLSKLDKPIKHLVFNDKQLETEKYILYLAGQPGSVTIATNVAGRGTDIILAKSCETKGLHAVIGFFPVNLRVECQALGRTARQGFPGSCEMVISRDEESINEFKGSLKEIYLRRTNNIKILSQIRKIQSEFYTMMLNAQLLYFESLKQLASVLGIDSANNSTTCSPSYMMVFHRYTEDWAKYLTLKLRGNQSERKSSEKIFADFTQNGKWAISTFPSVSSFIDYHNE